MPDFDVRRNLSALFSQQVHQTPDAVALEDDKTKYTYSELDKKVTDLADDLRSRGVRRDSLVRESRLRKGKQISYPIDS